MKKYLFFIIFFVITKIYPEIIEIKNIIEINEYLKKADLVIFDIDNTILEKSQTLGSDQWFDFMVEKYIKDGMSVEDAFYKVQLFWYEIEAITKVNLVEEEIKTIIARLQKNNVKVIGLTTRGFDLSFSAIRQLDSLSVDLQKTAPLKNNIASDELFYRKGIIFANGIDKGMVLDRFCKKINFAPKFIIFVDDKKKNLLALENYCSKNKIGFLGFRYGYLDEKRKFFDVNIANAQAKNFPNILSDEKAKELIKSLKK
jgi:hypothetical protein